MKDKTDQEHLNNPTNIQSGNPSAEIIPTKDTETIKSNQEVENMEVHKHPHHVTNKKKWGEYLLEFFMLFLAVFLGFVAENIRENGAEHEHEKQYAQELYNEFYADSVSFSNKLNARLDKEKNCDYLYSYIKDSSLTNLSKTFYPAYTKVFYLINSYTFEPKDGVLSQLKSTGSLRYFKDPKLQKLFGDVSVAISNMRYRNEQEYQFFANPVKPFLLEHYDFKWVDNVRKMSPDAYYIDLLNLYLNSDTSIKANILNLTSFNKEEAANMVMFYKTMVVSSRTLQMNDYIKTNETILQVLRKDYHLSNE
ncbi:MAG TPA: hypothetical protein VFP87_06445 [Chitinophagaceae bacterium]|nr:hypothetical protein [Chitinophagaceae bacterium]